MPDIYDFAMNLLQKNPDKANSPLGRELMRVIESRDYTKGAKMGENILQTYGVSKEDAISFGKSFFGF